MRRVLPSKAGATFRKTVWKYYRAHGRAYLPWRKIHDPYRILVSEVMLQQTQVDRVIPFYLNFVKRFPTVRALASAPLSDVLKSWQGLGYNRRARALHTAAREIVTRYKGKFPQEVQLLEALPGVGPYTARAMLAFAFNTNVIFIETNVRTAIMHHFFSAKHSVSDKEIEQVLQEVSPQQRGREWQAALMDYGAYLKRSGIRVNAQSAQYIKQQAFVGSLREVRGSILRLLSTQPSTTSNEIEKLLGSKRRTQIRTALRALHTEGLIQKIRATYTLAQ